MTAMTTPTPTPTTPGAPKADGPGVSKEFMIERNGKTYVLYAGLLELAHQEGLSEIETTIVQMPHAGNDNTAVVVARVRTERGTFTEIGDADPTNVNRMMLPHLLRMASTRAKARALRDAVNVGVVALEEVADGDVPAADQEPSERAAHIRTAVRAQGRLISAAAATAATGQTRPTQPARDAPPREWYAYLAYRSRRVKLAVPEVADDAGDDLVNDANQAMVTALKTAGQMK